MANAIDIVVNATDRASSKINKIGGAFDTLQKRAQKASGAITAIGAIGGAGLLAIGAAGAKMNSTLEQSDSRWTTLLKSSSEAEKQMQWMKSFSQQTPFNYQDIDQTATALMGMGLGLEDVNKWLPALGDASAVLGGGSETVKGLGMALGQMNAKGKVSAEEMQQLAERGVNAWSMLADGMNMTQGEVRKLSEDGKLLASDALPLIYEGMQKTFGGGTANLMKSTTGQAMLARENFNWLAQTLTQGAFDWFGANVLPLINKGLTALTNTFKGGLLNGFQKLWDSGTKAKTVLIALSGVLIGTLAGGLTLLVASIAPVLLAFSAFVAGGVAVAGAVALIMTHWDKLAPKFQQVVSYLMPIINGFVETFKTSFQTLKNSFAPLWESIKVLMKSLMPIITAIGINLGVFLTVALAVFNGVVSAIGPLIESVVWLGDMFVNVFMSIVALLSGDVSEAQKYWQKAVDSSVKAVQKLWEALKNFFTGMFSTIVNILSNFGIDVVSKMADMWSKAKKKTSDGINSVVDFFSELPSKVMKWVSSTKEDLVSGFKGMMDEGRSKVSDGISNIISTITGFGSKFLSAGKGLLDELVRGIKSGISKATNAVSEGMSAIRDFLPFSPAKRGPLSDLDKSGEAFFPTWYKGAMSKTGKMENAISGAMKAIAPKKVMKDNKRLFQFNNSSPLAKYFNAILQDGDYLNDWITHLPKDMREAVKGVGQEMSQLEGLHTFTGGNKMKVTHEVQFTGSVDVKGSGGESQTVMIDKVAGEVQNSANLDNFMSGFRQTVRSRK